MRAHELGPDYDNILAKLCSMVIHYQQKDPEEYGMVAACVVDPDGREVYGINHVNHSGHHVHAERAAIDNYREKYGDIDPDSTVITTLSPCSNIMSKKDRSGVSCAELLDNYGITHIYCGYQDPTQDSRPEYIVTKNSKIEQLCKRFADTFLSDEQLNELYFMGSPCTKDCSGHRAGYEWSRRKGGRIPNSWSPSFNKGAAIQRSGR